MVGFQLVGCDRDLRPLLARLEHRLREGDVLCDTREEILGVLDQFAVGVLPEVARGQDVVICVGGESLLKRLAVRSFDR